VYSTGRPDDPKVTALLRRARRYYGQSFLTHPGEIYPVVQELSLAAVLDGPAVAGKDWWSEKWATARTLGEGFLARPAAPGVDDKQQRAEVRGDLIELYLLALLSAPESDAARFRELARQHADRLANDYTDTFPGTVHSSRFQLGHYVEWYNKFNPLLDPLRPEAEKVLAVLAS
jgi:hypothetical protein